MSDLYNGLSIQDVITLIEDEAAMEGMLSMAFDDIFSPYQVGSVTQNIMRDYREFKGLWKGVKTEYMQADLDRDFSAQKAALWKEKHLIQSYLKKMDSYHENALVNIAFFVGLTALTVGLSHLVLTMHEAYQITDTGIKIATAVPQSSASTIKKMNTLKAIKDITDNSTVHALVDVAAADTQLKSIYNTSRVNTGAMKKLTQSINTLKLSSAGAISVSAIIANAAMALKMMGLMVSYTDASRTVLRSQRATGVLSKQMAIARLLSYQRNCDEKLRYIMTNHLLNTNEYALDAMNRYSESYLDNFAAQSSKMQEEIVRMSQDWGRRGANVNSPNTNTSRNNNEQSNNYQSYNRNSNVQQSVSHNARAMREQIRTTGDYNDETFNRTMAEVDRMIPD